MLDQAIKFGNILAWLEVGLVFYFTSQTDTVANIAKANERISVMDQKIEQEILGYSILQSSIGTRLDRIERKVDHILGHLGQGVGKEARCQFLCALPDLFERQ